MQRRRRLTTVASDLSIAVHIIRYIIYSIVQVKANQGCLTSLQQGVERWFIAMHACVLN